MSSDAKKKVHFNLFITNYEDQTLRDLSKQTGLAVSDLMRRMVDHCFQEKVLNQMMPGFSGQLEIGVH